MSRTKTPLVEYQAKRRFDKTPEPRGKKESRGGTLRFVVQKHDATRLHYDFRLELDGVLKSWAVPKGPSLNPSDKRLAIAVEDHPLEYRNFEGIIPEGNYGAGTVQLWDEGTYEPADFEGTGAEQEERLRAGLDKGHLSFILHGHKLRGRFALIKTKGRRGNEWLLMKGQDDYAEDTDVQAKDRSVRSRRTMAGIARGAPAKSEAKQSVAPHQPVKPMLATLVDEAFDKDGWLFEIKWDGYRAIAEVEDGKVLLYSRTGKPFSQYRPIVAALAKLHRKAILDGEIVVLDHAGRSSFQLLQNYQKTGRGSLVYFVFDTLALDDEDLRSRPLADRKELLKGLLKGQSDVRLSEHIERDGKAFYAAAAAHGLEGVMAKRASSTYHEGRRSQDWLKIKIRKRQDSDRWLHTAAGPTTRLGRLGAGHLR